MARPCPECSRPNADSATKCLYCTSTLDPAVAGALPSGAEPSDAGTPDMGEETADDRYLIILMPGAGVDDRTVQDLSDVTAISLYEARLSLQAVRPRIFRSVESEFVARGYSDQMARAGIPHYVVAAEAVRSMPIARAKRLDWSGQALVAQTDDSTVSVPLDQLLLLVRGEITRERRSDPMMRKKAATVRDLSPGLLLHIYSVDASVAVEVDPDGIEWPDLGREATRSAILNLEYCLEALEGKCPGVTLDRSFDLEPVVTARSGGDSDLASVLGGSDKSSAVIFDNRDQFRFYARWRYRLERHLAKSGSTSRKDA